MVYRPPKMNRLLLSKVSARIGQEIDSISIVRPIEITGFELRLQLARNVSRCALIDAWHI